MQNYEIHTHFAFLFQIKQEAHKNRFAPPEAIISRALINDNEKNPLAPLPVAAKPLNLKRAIQRQRASRSLPHPTHLFFDVSFMLTNSSYILYTYI